MSTSDSPLGNLTGYGAVKREQERIIRERAKEDFIQLGPRRSIQKLYTIYKDRAKKDGRPSVPTLHRPDLYTWAREDNWYADAQKRDEAEIESDRRNYEKIRRYVFDDLHDLSQGAVQVFRDILYTEEELPKGSNVKLSAAMNILDRIGLGPKNTANLIPEETEAITLPENITPENIKDFYQSLHKESSRK